MGTGAPFRSYGSTIWLPPESVPRPITYGWCHDRYFVDPAETAIQNDPMAPASVGGYEWSTDRPDGGVASLAADVLYIPPLRGAIQTPWPYFKNVEDYLTPVDPDTGIWSAWYDANTNPTGVWFKYKVDSLGGKKVALYSPTTLDDRAMLITKGQEPVARSFQIDYQLLAAENDEETSWPQYRGLKLHLGVQEFQPEYTLWLPYPHIDYPESNWLALYHWDSATKTSVVDRRRLELTQQSELLIAPHKIRVLFVGGRLLFHHTLLGETWWVVTPATALEPRKGCVAIEVFGARGWFTYSQLLFAETTEVVGPELQYSDRYTLDGEATIIHVTTKLDNPTTPDISVEGKFSITSKPDRKGRAVATVTNNSIEDYAAKHMHRRTGILFDFQEIHRTVIGTTASFSPLDLSKNLLEFSASYPETGRGATGTLVLRDYVTRSFELLEVLRGMGQIQVKMGHLFREGQTPTVPIFTGFATKIERIPAREGDMRPLVRVDVQDSTCVWQDGRATTVAMPDFTGWDVVDAITYIFEFWGIDASNLFFPSGYSFIVRGQELSGGLKFDPDTEIMTAVDHLCTIAGLRWHIRPDGGIVFRLTPETAWNPAFVLDAATVTDADKVLLPASGTTDFTELRNVSYARGKDGRGHTKESLHIYPTSVTDRNDLSFIGRELWRVNVDDSDTNPDLLAYRTLEADLRAGQYIKWRGYGRNIWPGDIVQCNYAPLGVPVGTRFKIVSKTLSYVAKPSDPVWTDDYVAVIVKDGVVV